MAIKRETQEIASSVTLEPIDELGVTLKAGKSYLVRGSVKFQVGADSGVKFGFTETVGSDLRAIRIAVHDSVLGTTPLSAIRTVSDPVFGELSEGEHEVEVSGYIQNSQGGNFLLTAAQNASNAAAITLYFGSYLELIEINLRP